MNEKKTKLMVNLGASGGSGGEETEVIANPTLVGTESPLTGLQVGDNKYKIEQPTEVIANPTLSGSEAALTGLQVGDTKFKVPSSGESSGAKIYRHYIGNLMLTKKIEECDLANGTITSTTSSFGGGALVIFSTVSTQYTKVNQIVNNFSKVFSICTISAWDYFNSLELTSSTIGCYKITFDATNKKIIRTSLYISGNISTDSVEEL